MSRFPFKYTLMLTSLLLCINANAQNNDTGSVSTTTSATTTVTTPAEATTPATTTSVTTTTPAPAAAPSTTVTTTTPATTTPVTTVTSTPTVVVERPIIVTTVPAPKETMITPTGYVNCFTVKAGWYLDIWAAEHKVCQYSDMPSGVAWVEGYWTCTKYNISEGQCTNWQWKAAHWEKTFLVY